LDQSRIASTAADSVLLVVADCDGAAPVLVPTDAPACVEPAVDRHGEAMPACFDGVEVDAAAAVAQPSRPRTIARQSQIAQIL
jgi:hypothetical protein